MKRFNTIFVFILASFCLTSVIYGKENFTVLRIIDGDTIVIDYNNKCEPLRLIGIDAPESRINSRAKRISIRTGQDIQEIIAHGKEATRFVKTQIHPGDVVSIEFDTTLRDKYRRLLGYIFLPDGRMLNDLIISEGYANILTIAPNTKHTQTFQKSLNIAMTDLKGLWN